jgi:hypothetical protein
VRDQIEETVLGLFLWPEGRFSFSEAAPTPELEAWMPPEYELAEPIETRGILLEGMRRLDEWARIVRVLPSDDARLIALGPAPDLPLLEEIAAHPEPPTLGQLLAWKSDGRFVVCEQLFRAVERGLLAFEAAAPGPDPASARGSTTVEHLCRAAEMLIEENQHEEAASLLRSALTMDPFRAEARDLLRRCHDAQLASLYDEIPRSAVPKLRVARERVHAVRVSPRDRRLLEHINDRWDVQALAITTALGELETLRALKRLMHVGVIGLA